MSDSHIQLISSASLTASYTHTGLVDLRNAESVSIHTLTSHNGSGIYPSGSVQFKFSSQEWKNYPSQKAGDKPASFVDVTGATALSDVVSGSTRSSSIISKVPVAEAWGQWSFTVAPGTNVSSGSVNVYVIVKGSQRR